MVSSHVINDLLVCLSFSGWLSGCTLSHSGIVQNRNVAQQKTDDGRFWLSRGGFADVYIHRCVGKVSRKKLFRLTRRRFYIKQGHMTNENSML